jgi:hypothetical protein
VNLRHLQRTERTDKNQERSSNTREDAAEASQPDHAPHQLPLHRSIVQLQSVIGNQNVMRMLGKGVIDQLTGSLVGGMVGKIASEMNPDEPQGIYFGDEEFHSKAQPKNQYYASNPPAPGWPYTDQLKGLWTAGNFNEFADEVASFQQYTLKLPDAQVDGILGPRTSRKLNESQGGAQTPPAPAQTPAAQTPGAEGTPAPAAENTPAQTAPPAPASETGETPATTPPAASRGNFPAPDDSAVSGHAVAARILAPVKQAFADYKESEKIYNDANRAMDKAKAADKASKEEERQTEMGKMEVSRAAARTIMDTARDQVAALTVSDFTSPAEMKQVIGYINRQLNTNTIYYTQMSNANILHGNGLTAAWRTCNMTVISMMLEALGKSSKDYTGDITKLQNEAGKHDEALGLNNTKPEDLTNLRLPDFLQLVAIGIAGSRESAASSITSHAFITDVARSFGLKVVDIKGDVRLNKKGEDEKSFLGGQFSSKLNNVGSFYRPAASDGNKELNKDETYKNLKGDEKKAYAQQFLSDFTEKRRLEYIANVDKWTEIDTQAKTQLDTLTAELNQPNEVENGKPRFFDAALQAKTDEIMKSLGDISTGIPKEYKGRQKQLNNIIGTLNAAIKKDSKKPDAPPKNLLALFDGKGNDDPIKQYENNFKKYAGLKSMYETLGEEGGIEQVIPLDEYKASVIPTMQKAIESGFQVMVNLDNHFVRLQSVAEDSFVIDDPGSRSGEDNKISWEQGRKYGYFQHYLLISQ